MDLSALLAIFQDLPGHLAQWTQTLGPWIYVLLFAIVFAETGLIITPFLPGDSLLFAVGALTAIDGGPDLWLCAVLLVIAAILGDAVNYSVGRWAGVRFFTDHNAKLLNPSYLNRAQLFYERHGGKAIIMARFLPILRTYAPFVAGLSRMNYSRFGLYNVIGGVAWILIFLIAGYWFGNMPSVKSNFQYVILAIIVISAMPAVFEIIRARRDGGKMEGAES